MKKSRTTLRGAIGGAATALQALPELPTWFRVSAIVVGAVAFAGLGYHATDCPPNCAGTDARGRRLGPVPASLVMGLLIMVVLTASLCAAVLFSGCTALVIRSHNSSGSGTNRVTKGATVYGLTFFDSGQVLGKTRATYEAATNGTWAPEISTAGVSQQASSTGVVTIIQNFPKMVPVP
jgi:hypothetical protein